MRGAAQRTTGGSFKGKGTWSEQNPDGRWRDFSYDELIQRDKCNLDIFWLRKRAWTPPTTCRTRT
jgi:hypothetical protein